MRLAAINTTASPFHAPASLMLDVANGFAAMSDDNRAMVLYGRGTHAEAPGVEFHKTGNDVSVIHHYLWSRTLDSEGLVSRRATAHIVEHLKAFHPDIVHLHNLHGHYLHYPTLFSWLEKTDVPVVITLHDLWLLSGRCCFPGNCAKWKHGCKSCEYKDSYPPTIVSRSKINHLLKSDCVNRLPNVTLVAPSEWVNSRVKESKLRLCPTVIIPNGVREDIFRHQDKSEVTNSDITNILAVANKWEARKRPEVIRELAGRLDDNEHLIIVGESKGLFTGLKNTTCVGPVTDFDKLVSLYNNADCTISLSTDETYGMTIAESMACGVPVIVPSASAMASYVRASDGLTVATPDAESYIKAIRRLMDSRNKFSPRAPSLRSESVSRYLNLFSTLIKSPFDN